MKELIVAQQLRRHVPGGIGTYVRGLVAGLSELHREPTLLASRVGDDDPLLKLSPKLRTVALPAPVLTRAWDYGVLRAPAGFDVVHATSLTAPPSKAPLTVMVHDLGWRTFPDAYPRRGRKWHEAAMQRCIKRAAKLITPSTQTANDLISGGVSHDRIVVIPHGHDHLAEPNDDAVDLILERIGLSPNAKFLLAVGTQEPRKNLPRLLAAYERIRDELPEPWPLLVVGPTGWGAQLKSVEGAVIISDATDGEVAALYSRCHLLAYVPLLEGYGLPVVEAMSMGAPVVATSVPSAGDAAFRVDPENVAGIAEGLLRVATDEGLRRDLIQRGEAHAANITWRNSAQQHLELWRSLT